MRVVYALPLAVLALRSSASGTLNFTQCGIDVINMYRQDPGSVTLLDQNGSPTNNPAEAWGIPLALCTMCGTPGSTEAFDWPLFSAAIAQWLLPWLALTAQLPYETRDGPTNVMALMLAVGSPMLITYSLCITILNSRWLNQQFARLRNENETLGGHQVPMLTAAVSILKEIQHVPIRIHETRRDFAQLIVNPRNQAWWTVLLGEFRRTKRDFTYSLGAQAMWVVVVALIAMVNFFSIIDRSTIRVIGVAINMLWAWMIPVTVGWVWVGTQNSANTIRDSLIRASSRVELVGRESGADEMVGFQDYAWENRGSWRHDFETNPSDNDENLDFEGLARLHPQFPSRSEAEALELDTIQPVGVQPVASSRRAISNNRGRQVQPSILIKPRYEGCRGMSGPIFNFARLPSHLETCSLVVEMFQTMNLHLHRLHRRPVDGGEWHADSADWAKNLEGTPEQMEDWLFPSPSPTQRPYINTRFIFTQAAILAAVLQWGTSGAAVLLAYQTPVVGLGCVSGAYLLYGVGATVVWALMVFSAHLSNRYAAALSSPSTAARLRHGPLFAILIPTTRYLGQILACMNAGWALTLSVLQFAGRYQNCWCMSIMGRAGWVILWANDQQIADAAWASWIGSAVLVVITVVAVTFFVLGGRGEEIFQRQRQ